MVNDPVHSKLPKRAKPARGRSRRERPNLLVLGASGHVAQAFLRRLSGRRDLFGRLILLDRNDQVLSNRFIEHSRLRYRFLKRTLRFQRDAREFTTLLRRYEIGIVLDLTDIDSMGVFQASDAAGVSYINTALNDANAGVKEMVAAIHPTRQRPRKAAHIIGSGMNPGAVNVWVMHGVRQYGVPREITHFEYDSSMAVAGWRPLITWSRREFLTETVWEPTGLVEDGQVKVFDTIALENRHDLRPLMEPVWPLEEYPHGFLVLHEENVKLGQLLGISSKYIYAIDPRTMDYLTRLWRQRGTVRIGDLALGDNTSIPLTGSDTIGVCLHYPHRRAYYINSLSNQSVVGTNATCAQVAVGVWAALITMRTARLRPQVYFSTDLYDTIYPHVLFSNLRVEHFVCGKRQKKWQVLEHVPELHPHFAGAWEPPVI